eukprot:3338405-Alexandrium_andersonii.AAC.1
MDLRWSLADHGSSVGSFHLFCFRLRGLPRQHHPRVSAPQLGAKVLQAPAPGAVRCLAAVR